MKGVIAFFVHSHVTKLEVMLYILEKRSFNEAFVLQAI